jgi:hypothetical protein
MNKALSRLSLDGLTVYVVDRSLLLAAYNGLKLT